MAKRRTSKLNLFRRVYSPLNHLVTLTRNVSKKALNTTRNVVDKGLGLVQYTGRSVVGHANGAVRGVLRGSRRRGNMRRSSAARRGNMRRSRRNTRRNARK